MPNNTSLTAPEPGCPLKALVPRRRGRPSRDAEAMPRAEIIRHAFTAFARDGYDGVSLRGLAAQCRVSDSLLTHHFGTKQQLWREAADSVFAPILQRLLSLLDTLAQQGDEVSTLQANLPRALKLMAADPVAIQFLFREGEGDTERGEYIRTQYVKPYLAQLDVLFERAQAQGHYRNVSAASRHVLVFGLMRSLVMPGVMRDELAPHLASPEAVSAYIDEVATLFYDGLVLTPEKQFTRPYRGAPS